MQTRVWRHMRGDEGECDYTYFYSHHFVFVSFHHHHHHRHYCFILQFTIFCELFNLPKLVNLSSRRIKLSCGRMTRLANKFTSSYRVPTSVSSSCASHHYHDQPRSYVISYNTQLTKCNNKNINYKTEE